MKRTARIRKYNFYPRNRNRGRVLGICGGSHRYRKTVNTQKDMWGREVSCTVWYWCCHINLPSPCWAIPGASVLENRLLILKLSINQEDIPKETDAQAMTKTSRKHEAAAQLSRDYAWLLAPELRDSEISQKMRSSNIFYKTQPVIWRRIQTSRWIDSGPGEEIQQHGKSEQNRWEISNKWKTVSNMKERLSKKRKNLKRNKHMEMFDRFYWVN